MAISTDKAAAGTVQDIAGRVRAALPVIAANAAESEQRRWIAEENIDLLTEAGMFRLAVPRQFGGADAPLADQTALISEVAAACPSTGWVCAIWCGIAWMVRLFPADAQREVFARDSVRASGVFAPSGTLTPVEGGYRLSGSWKWNTGCRGGAFHLVAAQMDGEDGPGFVLVPTSEFTIHDDWHAMGMAGTGSSTVSADSLFVPEYRVIGVHGMIAGEYGADAAVGGGRGYGTFPLIVALHAAQFTGIARGVLDAFLARIPGRGITYTAWTDQREHPHVQIQTAGAAAKIEAAECLMGRVEARLQDAADADRNLSPAERSWFRGMGGEIVELCREAVELLWSMAGASAIMRDVPLQRYFRDMESLALHAVTAPAASFEAYGRSLLGLDPGTPFL